MPITRSFIGRDVTVWHPEQVNIYDSTIGDNTKIASFVEIGGSVIGRDCKIQAHAFIPPGTRIGDGVFIGPHVVVCNDKYPNAMASEWETKGVKVEDGASVGAGSVILPGVTVGKNSFVGAGSVVAEDVAAGAVVFGEKAKCRLLL
jgi:UDP-2-acetamido-3-amino-2,3-dideoxy-glucuronate N-acetyltransferase